MIREILEAIGVYKIYQRWLQETIDHGEKPKHIGVITDGNRRWARSHNMESWQGHWEGADTLEKFLDWCFDLNIKTITLYSFSTENFNRDPKEVNELFNVFRTYLGRILESKRIHEDKIKIRALGRIEKLPEDIQHKIREVEEATKDYEDYYLNIAIAYGGRAEIVDAVRKLADKVKKGAIEPEEIDEEAIAANLYTAHLPNPEPDLIIRTSGESRLSNFLVWQSVYSELFLVDVYWPSIRKIDLMRAIRSYQMRQRRYGK